MVENEINSCHSQSRHFFNVHLHFAHLTSLLDQKMVNYCCVVSGCLVVIGDDDVVVVAVAEAGTTIRPPGAFCSWTMEHPWT